MTKPEQMLAAALVWDSTGHLADEAVTALVDGEVGLLPAAAVQHTQTCASCRARVGSAALYAVQLSQALVALELPARRAPFVGVRPAPVVRHPMPVRVLVAALLVIALGVAPRLDEVPAELGRLARLVLHDLPVLARGTALGLSAVSQTGAFVAVSLFSALLLVLGGALIARLVPQHMTWKVSP